jgi:hypothetical protein
LVVKKVFKSPKKGSSTLSMGPSLWTKSTC